MSSSQEYAGLTALQMAMIANASVHDDVSEVVGDGIDFVIDTTTKSIVNKSGKHEFAVGDHNSERLTFECDRYIEGHDILKCNVIRIHSINSGYPNIYDVDDIKIKEDDDTKVTFGWLLTSNAIRSVGKISFALRLKCVQDDGTETYSWGTKINEDMSVFDTMDNSETTVSENVDALEQLIIRVQSAADSHVEQIQKNTDDVEKTNTNVDLLKSDLSDLSKQVEYNDANNRRNYNFLYKLNQGISYQYETDSASAYQKDVPSGAKVASVNKVGGKTVVWNQLADLNGATSYSKEYSVESLKFTGTIFSIETISGHKYLYVLGKETADKLRPAISGDFPFIDASTLGTRYSKIITGTGVTSGLTLKNDNETDAISGTLYFNLIDLTLMFGSGNEPSTVSEFEAMYPADYYEYNAGTLMSAQVNEVVEQGKNLLDLTNVVSFTGGINYKCIPNKLKNNTKYTFSVINQNNYTGKFALYTDTNGESSLSTGTGVLISVAYVAIGSSRTFITPENVEDFPYLALCGNDATCGVQYFDEYDFQLEKGESATPYSPYHKTAYPIPQAITQLDGYGIGITDEVCNYVDWENRTYHKKCYKLVLTGSEAWSADATADGHRHNLHRSNVNFPEPANGTGFGKKSLCNIATYYSSGNNAPFGNFYISQNWLVFCDNDDKYADVDSWKSYLSSMYSNGTPVTIIYELAKEVVTDISDIIGDTFHNPFEVEAGGTLTFKNSNGDDYRIPVPNEEEYLISLAEVTA